MNLVQRQSLIEKRLLIEQRQTIIEKRLFEIKKFSIKRVFTVLKPITVGLHMKLKTLLLKKRERFRKFVNEVNHNPHSILVYD